MAQKRARGYTAGMEYYLQALKKYADFGGRSRRKEYWMFFLFNVIISIGLAIVEMTLGVKHIGMIYSLAVLCPGVAVGVRRLHDTGRSAWWMLIILVPIFGLLATIYFMVQDSEPGENAYGPNPKEPPPALPSSAVAA